MKIITALLLLLLSTSIFAQVTAEPPTQEQSQTSSAKAAPSYPQAPQWTLKDEHGKDVSYADYAGKPLIVTFWGTWCPYCKKLHPGLEKLRVKYESQGLQILAISVNEPFGADPAASLVKRGIHFPTLLDGDDVAIEKFEIVGTPSTVFISPDGKILGSTMESNPDDPRFEQVASYLVGLPRG